MNDGGRVVEVVVWVVRGLGPIDGSLGEDGAEDLLVDVADDGARCGVDLEEVRRVWLGRELDSSTHTMC